MALVYYLYPFSLFMRSFLEFSTSMIKKKQNKNCRSSWCLRRQVGIKIHWPSWKTPSGVNAHQSVDTSCSKGQTAGVSEAANGRQPLLTNGVEVTGECGRCVLLWSLEGWAMRPWVSRGVTGLWPWLLLIPVLTSHSSRWTWRGKWYVVKSWKFLEKEDNWEAPTPESERWVRNSVLLKFVRPPHKVA